jgi:hypothetical protein
MACATDLELRFRVFIETVDEEVGGKSWSELVPRRAVPLHQSYSDRKLPDLEQENGIEFTIRQRSRLNDPYSYQSNSERRGFLSLHSLPDFNGPLPPYEERVT